VPAEEREKGFSFRRRGAISGGKEPHPRGKKGGDQDRAAVNRVAIREPIGLGKGGNRLRITERN